MLLPFSRLLFLFSDMAYHMMCATWSRFHVCSIVSMMMISEFHFYFSLIFILISFLYGFISFNPLQITRSATCQLLIGKKTKTSCSIRCDLVAPKLWDLSSDEMWRHHRLSPVACRRSRALGSGL